MALLCQPFCKGVASPNPPEAGSGDREEKSESYQQAAKDKIPYPLGNTELFPSHGANFCSECRTGATLLQAVAS